MNTDYNSIPLINNENMQRFEMSIDESVAFIEYKIKEGVLFLIHTEVPGSLQGKGAGSAIIEKTLQYAKANGFVIKPICPFVLAYLKRHTEWNMLLS